MKQDKNMADWKLKLGDMLPGGLLTEQEWLFFKKEFAQEENTKSKAFFHMFLNQCMELAETHCTGENAHRCIICGAKPARKEGICQTCYSAVRTRGVLRQCGYTHTVKNTDLICAFCGELPAVSKGLCRNCFAKMKVRGLNSAEALINFEKLEEPKNTFFIKK